LLLSPPTTSEISKVTKLPSEVAEAFIIGTSEQTDFLGELSPVESGLANQQQQTNITSLPSNDTSTSLPETKVSEEEITTTTNISTSVISNDTDPSSTPEEEKKTLSNAELSANAEEGSSTETDAVVCFNIDSEGTMSQLDIHSTAATEELISQVKTFSETKSNILDKQAEEISSEINAKTSVDYFTPDSSSLVEKMIPAPSSSFDPSSSSPSSSSTPFKPTSPNIPQFSSFKPLLPTKSSISSPFLSSSSSSSSSFLLPSSLKSNVVTLISNFNSYLSTLNNNDISHESLLLLLQHHLILLKHHTSIEKEKKIKERLFDYDEWVNQDSDLIDESEVGREILLNKIFCSRTNWMMIFSYLSEFG
jgi:hypothetical protein